MRSLIPGPLAGLTILDAGCGSGAQSEWLLDEGANVVGLDLSPAMVEETRIRCGDRGEFLVADLAEPVPLPARSVDGVTCSLVLHYLEDWRVPLRSFSALLRPGGWVIISLDHPFGPPLSSQRGTYFDAELVSDTWDKAGVVVTQHFWRRPLASVIDAFSDAGFVVDRIAEARPSQEALERFPEELLGVEGTPSFISYRLRLLES